MRLEQYIGDCVRCAGWQSETHGRCDLAIQDKHQEVADLVQSQQLLTMQELLIDATMIDVKCRER